MNTHLNAIIAALASILPVLQGLDLTHLLGPDGMAIYAAGVALVMAVVGYKTKSLKDQKSGL